VSTSGKKVKRTTEDGEIIEEIDENAPLLSEETIQKIIKALQKSNMCGKAGEILEHLGHFDLALKNYTNGHVYRPAVQLAQVCGLWCCCVICYMYSIKLNQFFFFF
jgi:hypothetical protein